MSRNKQNKSNDIQKSKLWIYGKNSVLFVLELQKRKIFKLFVSKSNKEFLLRFIQEKNIKLPQYLIQIVDNEYLNNLLDESCNHQGFLAEVSQKEVLCIDDFISKECNDKNYLPKLAILDQITDPHNVGAIVRSAVAFGVKNIIITKRNSPTETSVIYKTSSGMLDLVNLIEVSNLNDCIKQLKKVGYWVVGLAGEGGVDIKEIDNKNIALVIGSEGKGLRELVEKNCDVLVKINISNEVESLNASVAAALSFYILN